VRRHKLDASRVVVAPPGVDAAAVASPTATGGRLACVAAVIPRKGHDVLVAALSRVADLEWTCVCAGPLGRDPRYVTLVRQQVAAEGLDGRVSFPGPLGGHDVAALYDDLDLLVVPSRAEPYGMVVTEALARAVPVLAAAVDGLPEALGAGPDGGLPGMLVPPDDAEALAAALRRWLTEPSLRQRLRAVAFERRSRLPTWEVTASALAGVVDRLDRTA
jgi:glycosyltransferase involved in cell wall biosynthesis